MLARQSYRQKRRIATIFLALFAAASVCRASDDPHLYVFCMPGCRPCQQMEPDVDRLIQAGYPVTKIDCVANEAWANHFQITQAPTTILVADEKVVTRSLGPQNFGDLVKLFDAVNFRPGQSETKLATLPSANAYVNAPVASNVATAVQPASVEAPASTSASAWTQPKHLAHQATIRIKVDDPQGTSYATGTVIHRHGEECLAITCGHVFRESRGSGTITVEYGFSDGQLAATSGQLIKYDSDARDVGLIAFRAQRPIEPVRIGPEALPIQPGDQAFSFGCDHGQVPSLRETQVIRTAVYDGASKYDIVGRPVDGRSGGGLFSPGGQLIGICNAAAVEVDEGVYTSLENIYWQLNQAQLSHLFHAPTAAVAVANVAAEPQIPDRLDVRAPSDPVSVNGEVEIIMVVRSKSNPEIAETFSVQQPSAQLLGLVQSIRASESSVNGTVSNRENFPDPQMANETGAEIRGQSYR